MRKFVFTGAVLAGFLVIGIIVLYYTQSTSAILRSSGFSKSDVVAAEGYSADSISLTRIMLLANKEKQGLVSIERNGRGWKPTDAKSILDQPENGKFVTVSLPIMKNLGVNAYTEKHVFVAGYIDGDEKPQIPGTSDFYINVDYFTVGERVLLFAHAIAGKNKTSFGSDEVITYLNSFHAFFGTDSNK